MMDISTNVHLQAKITSVEDKNVSTPSEITERGDEAVDHDRTGFDLTEGSSFGFNSTKNDVEKPLRDAESSDNLVSSGVHAHDGRISASTVKETDLVRSALTAPEDTSLNISVDEEDQQLMSSPEKSKKHVQFQPVSLVTGALEPADPWKDGEQIVFYFSSQTIFNFDGFLYDMRFLRFFRLQTASTYDKGSAIRLYIETNLKFRTTPLTSVIHSITLRPGEHYSHQGDLIIDYSDSNIKQISQREVDALEPVFMKYQWNRIIIGRKLQVDVVGGNQQHQDAALRKYASEIGNNSAAIDAVAVRPSTTSAAAVTTSIATETPVSGLLDEDEIDLRVENARFCGSTFADDATAASFIDMIEYYKSCQQLVMCYVKNLGMTSMLSLSKMLRRPNTSLRALELRGSGYWIANSSGGLAGSNSMTAGDGDRNLKIFSISLRQACSTLRYLRLESCNLTGRSFFLLCAALRLNPHIRRVFLGDNQLQASDMVHMSQLLRNKLPTLCGIDVLDLRNNNIGVSLLR